MAPYTQKKPAEQSSLAPGGQGNPSRAVDGKLNYQKHLWCTATDPGQDGNEDRWFRVDMGQLYKVFYVRISRPIDSCCSECRVVFTSPPPTLSPPPPSIVGVSWTQYSSTTESEV